MTDRSHSHVAHVKANHFLSATNKQYARTQNEGLFWQKKKKKGLQLIWLLKMPFQSQLDKVISYRILLLF